MSGERSTTNSTGAGGNAETIREFLYLDFPKLTSYYAQLQRGLITSSQETTGYVDRDVARGNQVEAGGNIGIAAGANPSNLDPSFLRLLGLVAQLDAKMNFLVRSGIHEIDYSESRHQIETKQLHHEIYALIEEILLEEDLIAKDANDKDASFYAITGRTEIIDFSFLAQSIENFPTLGKQFSKLTGSENFAASVANPKELSAMIKRFYADQIGVILTSKGRTATAYLQREHLTAPISFITDNYGRQTQVHLTLFGLKVGEHYPQGETSGQATFASSQDDEDINSLGSMTQALLKANRGLEGMDRFFRVRGDLHLYPIAIYLDLRLKK